LTELWFHTGTVCNLQCPFCLEGSGPNVHRIEMLTLSDATPFIEEATDLGVKQFSFTGGEPFVVPDFPDILDLALQHRPCLVLTNGTEPLFENLPRVRKYLQAPHPLRFRVSLDYADERRHDGGRGQGNFRRAIDTMRVLEKEGFELSVARHRANNEDVAKVDQDFRDMFADHGLDETMSIVSFPEFFRPNTPGRTPVITEDCMTEHHTADSRSQFMCAYSRMVVKKNGRCGVYACTLVDDDPDYDLGDTLSESLRARVMLRHHRCFSCFACGASCSDPNAAL
jgi:molybdenum cofactor biosynthesis enzyme MoaA